MIYVVHEFKLQMASINNNWNKTENDDGYPCYIDPASGKQQFDHPQFHKLIDSIQVFNEIKYSVYRLAYKIDALQKYFKVPPIRISSGVFAHHKLTLSESSLSLDTIELEAVLADIYFAAEKDGLFDGDVDLAVDLLINLLLNVYDKDRKEPVRVLAAKTLLIVLSSDSVSEKWTALAQCCADHNGCVSPKRLTALLVCVTTLTQYLGDNYDQVQADVDTCFLKSAGMLGLDARAVAEWGARQCGATRWLAPAARLASEPEAGRATGAAASCACCHQAMSQALKFKCSKCIDVYLCDKCYLYDKELSMIAGHKKTHLVHEIVDGELNPSQCLSFMQTVRRFFYCTATKKKKTCKKTAKRKTSTEQLGGEEGRGTVRRRKGGGPAMFTSTVSKASGHQANNPAAVLQDVITQLEVQNRALKEISDNLRNIGKGDDDLQIKVDTNYNQISAQIKRLIMLKENLTIIPIQTPEQTKSTDTVDRPQAFDIFSPILAVDEKQTKTCDLKNQPRVLSLDSGNFSVASKHENQNLLTMSGDALRPVVVHAATDSVATLSMNDITSWYVESNRQSPHGAALESASTDERRPDVTSQSLSATEQRFADDIRSVESSNDKMRELNADLDTVLDRLQQLLTTNFAVDDSCFDNTQLRETATEMEGLLGTLIRGVEQRVTLTAARGHCPL